MSTSSSPSVSSGTSTSTPTAAPYAFVESGQVLGPREIGAPPRADTGTADVSAIGLPDGRIRLYFGLLDGSGGLGKIGSAISSDAIHFTVEPGLRQPTHRGAQDGFASPFVFQLPGGGYRLFYTGGGGISSETSADGLTFTRDPGLRLAENALAPLVTQQGQPVCSAIVKLAERRYRMYCSQEVQAGASSGNTIGTRAIFSAVSSDLLIWTPEPGIRIGPGAPSLIEDAAHPTAIANTDGSVALIYYRYPVGGPEPQEMISISKDGLAFSSEADTGIRGTEPSLLRRTDGSLLVYYGEQTPADGSTIWLARG